MGNTIGSLVMKNTKTQGSHKVVSFVHDDQVYFTPRSHQSELLDEQEEDDIRITPGLEGQTETPSFACEICFQQRRLEDSFYVKGCVHFYCTRCTISYVVSKLELNMTCVQCPVPKCEGVLEPEYCRSILPDQVFDRWGVAQCEAAISESEKSYCPFRDCSALLINDGLKNEVSDAECPACKRVFCVRCQVPRHEELDCKRFQKLKKRGEDALMIDLAERNKWRRCPHCKFYVERGSGCSYMMCRCGSAFCYNCGSSSLNSFHVCNRCKR